MGNEIWKAIPSFEGEYEISCYGNIRSLDRIAWNGKVYLPLTGKLLKPSLDRDGYYHIRLSKLGKKTNLKVHRLVAKSFVENKNPTEFTVVNHLDCNRLNNHYNNLDWTTHEGNTHHAKRMGRFKRNGKNLTGYNKQMRKPLIQATLDGDVVAEWDGLGRVPNSIISRSVLWRALNGRTKFGAKGFIWKYK